MHEICFKSGMTYMLEVDRTPDIPQTLTGICKLKLEILQIKKNTIII